MSKHFKNCISCEESPVISVIVPVYNTKKFLSKCIESILSQTFEQLEIILVDDASTDGSSEILEKYAAADQRIKVIRHKENRGLFQARLTGYTAAQGQYIAFVDSDDYISVDWFRMLLRKAQSSGADITVGEWCFDYNHERKEFCNLDHFRLMDYHLTGHEIAEKFMAVQGRNFSWTVVWNKLYSKKLWDRCYPQLDAFSNQHGHMLMWEDIAFSCSLWLHASSVANVHGAYYFYFKHEGASTAHTANRARNQKYIQDAAAAIWFMDSVLKETGLYDKFENDFNAWKKWGMCILYKDLVVDLNRKSYKHEILNAFHEDALDYEVPDSYFYSICTPLHASFDWLENLKKEITDPQTHFVSFDVFDTLIQRPFYYPSDLFSLLSERFNDGLSSYVNFKQIRQSAEAMVRQETALYHPSKEDITLDEIYQYIQDNYAFTPEKLELTKQTEIELELRFCKTRAIGKELFDLAKESGKSIIICSDMYLPAQVIDKILKANGYEGYQKLYVSSDLGISKDKKTLYKFVQKDLNCRNSSAFIHLGDNWFSDVENPKSCGWRSSHLAKAADLITCSNPGVYSGEAYTKLYHNAFFKEDYRLSFQDFTAIRCITALAANKSFASPFVSFHPQSDFNADPRLIGYSALGPHLLALCHWIHKNKEEKQIGTVHFVARDGYLVKQAYNYLYPSEPTNYLRLSRKALVLADVECIEDLYSLFNKVNSLSSPQKLAEMMRPIIPNKKWENLAELFQREGFRYKRKLKSQIELEQCMSICINKVVDMSLLPAYKTALKNYFSEIIQPGDFLFDVGYSGRPESALSNILGFPVGSLYIHVNGEIAAIRQEKYNCPCEVFYNYKPCITGVIREHLLMELGPSTLGYGMVDGKLEPILEPYEASYCSEFITRIIQDHALQFVKDYQEQFHDFAGAFFFQNEPASAPFEYYMHFSKPIDRQPLSVVPFEDDLGAGKPINALDFWNKELYTRNLGAIISETTTHTVPGDVIPGLYIDGYMMKFIRIINKLFPRGGVMREILKKTAHSIESFTHIFRRKK